MANYKAYAGAISSVELQSITLVGSTRTYQYLITLTLTEIITNTEDTYDAGTDVQIDLSSCQNARSITGITRFSSNDGITSIVYYCDFNEDGRFGAYVNNYKGGTVDLIGTFPANGSLVWLAPAPPAISINYISEGGRAFRRISAYNNTLSHKRFALEAHYYDADNNPQVIEFDRVEAAYGAYFEVEDDNVYPSNVTYKAKFISYQYDYMPTSGMEFESAETEEELSHYMPPFPAELYGTRARRGNLAGYLLYKSSEGMQLDWTFRSSDGSSQQRFDCEISGDVTVSKSGGTAQGCYFDPAEIGGPNVDDAFLVTLDTYGGSSTPATTLDFAYCVADLSLWMLYEYTLATSTIDITIGGPTPTIVESLEFTGHINLKDEDGNIVYTDTNSVFLNNGNVVFSIDIDDIEYYDPDENYTLEYTVFSNILEGFSFSGEEALSEPAFTRPADPVVDVEVVDDYCNIEVTLDANAKYLDVICRYDDKEFYIARRAEVTSATETFRFNTPPIGIDFEISARAYGDFYMPSGESEAVESFVQCDSNVYVNYMSATDTEHSRYTEKFAVRVNAEFSESVANNLEQYSVIGKYDKVTQLEGNASRDMSLAGNITYRHGDIQLFETFATTAQKCVVRIPKSGVFYCYVSSAEVEKTAGARNAKVNIKLLIDSSIASEQTVTYDRYAAMVAYAEQVLAELL